MPCQKEKFRLINSILILQEGKGIKFKIKKKNLIEALILIFMRKLLLILNLMKTLTATNIVQSQQIMKRELNLRMVILLIQAKTTIKSFI